MPRTNPLKTYHPVMTPEPPPTPFATGAPYWYWLGGRPALDLVNTRRERWRGNIECLRSAADLAEWLTRAGLLERPAFAGRGLLTAAVELREAIDAGVRAAVAGEPADPAALAIVDGWLEVAAPRPALVAAADGLPLLAEHAAADPLEAALGAVALDAARMLGRAQERERVRICCSDTCSARFYDRSPAARRRWCSMAGCGNVAKARRFRARESMNERLSA
jgi:predicted RNA-binding Zn ribbon-like protein